MGIQLPSSSSSGGGGYSGAVGASWLSGGIYSHGFSMEPTTSNNWGSGRIYLNQGQVPQEITNSTLAQEVSTSGTESSAGSGEYHMVLYDNTGSLVASKSVDATTSGVKEMVLSQTIGPGVFWAGAWIQGWSTDPTITAKTDGPLSSEVDAVSQYAKQANIAFDLFNLPIPSSIDLSNARNYITQNDRCPLSFWKI